MKIDFSTPTTLNVTNYLSPLHVINSCSVNWESQTFNATTYIVFLFVFGLFVPLCVISHSYVMIIRTMKQNTIRSGKVNKVETKVTRMILVMIIGKNGFLLFCLIRNNLMLIEMN